jgi:hypothetical protein
MAQVLKFPLTSTVAEGVVRKISERRIQESCGSPQARLDRTGGYRDRTSCMNADWPCFRIPASAVVAR